MDNTQEQTTLIFARFPSVANPYIFDSGGIKLEKGDMVIVNTEKGESVARVVGHASQKEAKDLEKIKPVKRRITEADEAKLVANEKTQQECKAFCRECIKARNLSMRLSVVEKAFDGKKIAFYFVADKRIDFRDLLKDLVEKYRTRIELRQIGVRQEAAIIGGVGVCGRELCCSSYMTTFRRISVKMAKNQNLALNPAKISGLCGKLKCCLAYEEKTYEELMKSMPKQGKKVFLEQGHASIVSVNIINQTFVARLDDSRFIKARPEDVMSEENYLSLAEQRHLDIINEQKIYAKTLKKKTEQTKKTSRNTTKKRRPSRRRRTKKKGATQNE
ncbi:MAG: regulatory iron-sulfur-containing complex subunit RicT [Thermodesulfobacteriota bacterium]|nr:regulatory iron-sulfur-containing complex subunit RicT [Thermodesulfobacteriota bacterium]